MRLQLVSAVRDHELTRPQATPDDADGALGHGDGNLLRVDGFVRQDDVDVRSDGAVLNGRRGNRYRSAKNLDLQLRVDELIREQSSVLVGKDCLAAERPGVRVDLVVNGQETATLQKLGAI